MRTYQGESDLQLIVDLIDACEQIDKLESFVSIEQLRSSITNPAIDRERDLRLWEEAQGKVIGFGELSIAEPIDHNLADGKFASICLCVIDRTHNTFVGRQEGWVALLFTHPDFQRRGLARAMLLHGLDRLKDLGMDIAKIGVDAQNPFGARRLYESVGFEYLYTNIAYVKHL